MRVARECAKEPSYAQGRGPAEVAKAGATFSGHWRTFWIKPLSRPRSHSAHGGRQNFSKKMSPSTAFVVRHHASLARFALGAGFCGGLFGTLASGTNAAQTWTNMALGALLMPPRLSARRAERARQSPMLTVQMPNRAIAHGAPSPEHRHT